MLHPFLIPAFFHQRKVEAGSVAEAILIQIENEPEEELVEVFKIFDKNGDEKIDAEDLKVIFTELGEDVTDEECRLMIDEHDLDGD